MSPSSAIFPAVMKVEAVPGMNLEPGVLRLRRTAHDAIELGGGRGGIAGCKRIAPGAGVDLDDRRTNRARGFDLRRFGGDEERHANAGSRQLADRRLQGIALAGGIETAFGGALRAAFRDDAGRMRA